MEMRLLEASRWNGFEHPVPEAGIDEILGHET